MLAHARLPVALRPSVPQPNRVGRISLISYFLSSDLSRPLDFSPHCLRNRGCFPRPHDGIITDDSLRYPFPSAIHISGHMSSLGEVYDEGSRRWAVVRATLLLAGSFVAVVGFVTATASLVAGFGLGKAGALKVATLLGGALMLGAFLVLFARGPTTGPSRLLASVGATFAVVGLALFWTTLPAGWMGHLSGLPTLAVGTYAVGLLAVFAAGFAGDSDATGQSADAPDSAVGASDSDSAIGVSDCDSAIGVSDRDSITGASDSDSLGGVETMMTASNDRDAPGPSSAVGDGGAEEEDLQFFDDEDS